MQFGMFYDSGCDCNTFRLWIQPISFNYQPHKLQNPRGHHKLEAERGFEASLEDNSRRWERREGCHPITANSDLPQSSDPPAKATYYLQLEHQNFHCM